MRFELSSRQKHMAHLGLRVGAGWGDTGKRAGGSGAGRRQRRCLGARMSISVSAEGLKINHRRAEWKKETPFLTFWRTHVVAHFDEQDDDQDDDEHDDDGHVAQDCHAEGLVVVCVFVCTCIWVLELGLLARLFMGVTQWVASIIAHPQTANWISIDFPCKSQNAAHHLALVKPRSLPLLTCFPFSSPRSYNNQQRQQKFIFIGRTERCHKKRIYKILGEH